MAIPLRAGAKGVNPINLAPNVSRSIRPNFRLWLGIALLLLSIIGITRLIAQADSRISVVALAQDVPTGKVITANDLQIVKVSVPHPELYFADLEVATGSRAIRNMVAGELLPLVKSKIASPNTRIVSIPVKAGHLPNISTGDVVDIWSAPALDGLSVPTSFDVEAKLLVSGVTVNEVPDAIDSTSDTAISAFIPQAQISQVLTAARAGQIDIVGHALDGAAK